MQSSKYKVDDDDNDLLDDMLEENVDGEDDELKVYMNSKIVHKSTDVLQWWKVSIFKFS